MLFPLVMLKTIKSLGNAEKKIAAHTSKANKGQL